MARTEMHAVSAEGMARAVALYEEELAARRRDLSVNCYAAHAMHRRALSLAAVRWAGTRDEAALALDLAVVAEAGVVCFEAALAPEAPITHHLGPDPETPVTVPARGDRSFAVAEVFCDTFHAARLLRAGGLLDRLCGAPADLLEADAESPPFRLALAGCLRVLWRDGAIDPAALLAAMEATDPQSLPDAFIDEAVGHAAPLIHLLDVLGKGDAAQFAETLAAYQAAHLRHYGLEKHAVEDRGLLSLDQAAVAAMAVDRGMDPDPQSDYLPAGLILHGPAGA